VPNRATYLLREEEEEEAEAEEEKEEEEAEEPGDRTGER